MALITCPHCGRKGVYDKALWCPGCKYNVKEHFYQKSLPKIEKDLLQSIEENYWKANTAENQVSEWENAVKKSRKRMGACAKVLLGCALYIGLVLLLGDDTALRRFLSSPGIVVGSIALIVLFYSFLKQYDCKQLIKSAAADMERFAKEDLSNRKAKALRDLKEKHQPYAPQHKITEHICPQCGYDVDFMQYICPECGRILVQDPKPNPGAIGDIGYMWCPHCGSKALRRTSSTIGKKMVLYTTCMSCRYQLYSDTMYF